MDIQQLIETGRTAQLPIEQLRALAANPAAFGEDLIEVFAAQAERRAAAAGTVLSTAENEQRDLLASERRSYDRQMLEGDAIRGLQTQVETRTAQRSHVPVTQQRTEDQGDAEIAAVLEPKQPMRTWLETRGGHAYAGERGFSRHAFGKIIKALVTGQRQGLTDLEQRALAEGSGSTGGYTVPEILATSFIDRVRNALVVQRAGARIVPMTSDVLHIARLAQPGVYTDGSPLGGAPQWKVENDPIAEGGMTLERVTFNAKTLPILIKMSVELSEDSVNIDEIIERELSAAFALELDRVALMGSGTGPEPDGILNQSNVTVDALNSTPSNYDFLVNAVGDVWAQNHDPNAILYNSTLATYLAKLKDSTGQPLQLPPAIANIPRYRSNVIEGVGSPAGDSTVFVGDFSQLLIGMRTSFRLEATRIGAGAFENLQIAIRAYLRADIQLAHPEAFVVQTGVDTTV